MHVYEHEQDQIRYRDQLVPKHPCRFLKQSQYGLMDILNRQIQKILYDRENQQTSFSAARHLLRVKSNLGGVLSRIAHLPTWLCDKGESNAPHATVSAQSRVGAPAGLAAYAQATAAGRKNTNARHS